MKYKIKAKLKLRNEYEGRPIRDGVKEFDGQSMNFRYGWEMDEGDPYPGETAWIPDNENLAKLIGWIASGDMEIELDEEEHK